jgi:hypothetical protein
MDWKDRIKQAQDKAAAAREQDLAKREQIHKEWRAKLEKNDAFLRKMVQPQFREVASAVKAAGYTSQVETPGLADGTKEFIEACELVITKSKNVEPRKGNRIKIEPSLGQPGHYFISASFENPQVHQKEEHVAADKVTEFTRN